jgi:conjugative relaxase-like TrwC/TraI family protein
VAWAGVRGSSAREFDATFSTPKSVSVLWAISPDPWVRAEVAAAHDAAVTAAIDWLETHGAVTRRGAQGTSQVDTQGLTVALFRQHTSRTVDPQLHTHALIAAKVQDPSGRWLSLDARFLLYQQRTIDWVYDAALRAELTGRLGVAWRDLTGGKAADVLRAEAGCPTSTVAPVPAQPRRTPTPSDGPVGPRSCSTRQG